MCNFFYFEELIASKKEKVYMRELKEIIMYSRKYSLIFLLKFRRKLINQVQKLFYNPIEIIDKSGLFDREWYLSQNSDVVSDMCPIEHYLCYGAQEGRDPSPTFSNNDYLAQKQDGVFIKMNPLLHYIKYGKEKNFLKSNSDKEDRYFPANISRNVERYLSNLYPTTGGIDVLYEHTEYLRLNLVVDSLADNIVFGGVATALIFSLLLSNKTKSDLRIIVRDLTSSASAVYKIAKLHKINVSNKIELVHFPINQRAKYKLPISENDLFIASSWWSSYAIKQINMREKFIYILQEDENIFYPSGYEQIKVNELFNDTSMVPIINTHVLFEHFKKNSYEHIKNDGLCFEPAFPYIENIKKDFGHDKTVFNLFFYSRPSVPRNLFSAGLELIYNAIKERIIDGAEWKIYFAGQNMADFVFFDGTSSINLGKLSLEKYVNFIPTVDLAICLMNAPCPSYIPLDLASVGAVVLTNKYKEKKSLNNYSENIICSDTDLKSLLDSLSIAIKLAKNSQMRRSNFSKNNISLDWSNSFNSIIDQINHRLQSNLL